MSPRSGLHRNWITYSGGLLALAGVVLTSMGMLFEFSIRRPSPYSGIITFVLFPAVVVMGLLIALAGVWHESRRRRRAGSEEARRLPTLDLNDPRQRRRFTLVAISASVLLVVFAFAGYNGYLLTESVPFCGSVCHTPMGPEMTAYRQSPHARVRCVDCHVGEGAGHYVQSKLNGVAQLAGVVLSNYDRPIPTPVKGLRPARETCQSCHWPAKSWGSALYQRPHFRYDEAATPEQITMLMRIGGGEGAFGMGIHWHMAVANEVTFVAQDDHLQSIPWVRLKRGDGTVTEYFRTEKPIDPADLATMTKHTMDCIDCHNRPAHSFETPDIAVDRSLSVEFLPHLPWVKSLSVDTLATEFASRDAAHAGIHKQVTAFYATKYPDVAAGRAADVDRLVAGLDAIYDRNVFPEMHVSWKSYPSNIGHRNSPGCFRCHDGKHVSATGETIKFACDVCHTEPKRGPPGVADLSAASAERDWHPWQTPEKHLAVKEHKNIQCYECHVAGRRPKTECNECHSH